MRSTRGPASSSREPGAEGGRLRMKAFCWSSRETARVPIAEEVRRISVFQSYSKKNTLFHESATSHQKTKTPITTSAPRTISSIFLTRSIDLVCGCPQDLLLATSRSSERWRAFGGSIATLSGERSELTVPSRAFSIPARRGRQIGQV